VFFLCVGGCDDAVLCVVCASEAEVVGAGVMSGPDGSDRRSGARRWVGREGVTWTMRWREILGWVDGEVQGWYWVEPCQSRKIRAGLREITGGLW
jgi:hypothetical protein